VELDKCREALKPMDKDSKLWYWWVGISFILVVITVVLKVNEVFYEHLASTYDITITVLVAVLTAFLLNVIHKRDETKKIKDISNVSKVYEDLLPNFLYDLGRLDGKYRKDERIDIKIRKYDDAKSQYFYKLEIGYEYKTTFKNSDCIKFMFKRHSDGNIDKFTGGINEELLGYDFFWGMDESGFPQNILTNEDYILQKLMIDTKKIDNSEVERKKDIVLNDNGDTTINYILFFENPHEFRKTAEHSISYKIIMPIQKEDMLKVTHYLPTFKATVSFDFTETKDEITAYGIPSTGLAEATSPDNSTGEAEITYKCDVWILPNQGYTFCWWGK